MEHLTPEQLTAYRDNALEDAGAADHIRGCAACRAGLVDARLRAALIRSGAPENEKPDPIRGMSSGHPGEHLLAAYYDDALLAEERARVEEHLLDCRECVEALAFLRDAMMEPSKEKAPRELVEQIRQTYRRTGERQMLGRLILEQMGRLRLQLQAGMGLAMGPGSGLMRAAAPNPASARARRQRHLDRSTLREQNARYSEAWETPGGFSDDALRDAARQRRSEPAPAVPLARQQDSLETEVNLEIGDLRLRLRTDLSGGETALDVWAINMQSGRPVRGLELRVAKSGQESAAATEYYGKARLLLPPGRSILVVETDPPVELEVLNG